VIAFTKDKAERLRALTEQQLAFFEEILKLTSSQSELIELEDIEEFEKSLNKREDIIEKIKGLHQESDPLMQSYTLYKNSTAGKKIAAIDTVVGRLRAVISEAMEVNQLNMEKAASKKSEYSEKIAKLNEEKKGLSGYKAVVPNQSQLIDKTQ
jgi:flagellin-specific chaperone FliS